jgi:uncharacterized lipoprotein YajG
MFQRLVIAALVAALSGCAATSSVGVKYSPPAATAKSGGSVPPVSIGSFSDDRGKPSNYLGSIRGGFGNPLKTLESDRPVGEIVQAAFTEALRVRGAAGDGAASNRLTGSIKRLECNQYVRREAHVEIDVAVLDKAGQRRFARTYSSDQVAGAVIALDTGIFASVDDLRAVLEKALSEAVDKALDDPDLRAALRQ